MVARGRVIDCMLLRIPSCLTLMALKDVGFLFCLIEVQISAHHLRDLKVAASLSGGQPIPLIVDLEHFRGHSHV